MWVENISFIFSVSFPSGCRKLCECFKMLKKEDWFYNGAYGNLEGNSRCKNNKTTENRVGTNVSFKAGRGGRDLF